MYATARNNVPPLELEDMVKVEYRCDGSSSFFAETCVGNLNCQWCSTLLMTSTSNLFLHWSMVTVALVVYDQQLYMNTVYL